MNQLPHRPASAPKILGLTSFVLAALLALLLWSGVQAQSATDSAAPQPAAGATWYVDAAVPVSGDGRTAETALRTIPEGLALAAAGDTVLVAAGLYTETALPGQDIYWYQTLPITTGVSLVGAGAGESVIAGSRTDVTVTLARNSRLEGFTLRGGNVSVKAGGASVLSNRIEAKNTGIAIFCYAHESDCSGAVQAAFNVIDGIAGDGVSIAGDAVAVVRNNTIRAVEEDGWEAIGIRADGTDAIIEGNAILGASVGVLCDEADTAAVAHNNVEGSKLAYYTSCTLGGSNTKYASMLRNPAAGDLRLTAGSPLRGRGPAGSDIGALPFAPVGVAPATINVTAHNGRQVQVQWTDTGAAAYDLFVGGEDGVYTERHAMTGTTSAIITITSPLANVLAVSSVNGDGTASELTAAQYIPPPLRDATVEQDSAPIWIDGDWRSVANPNASGGSHLESTGPSAQVRIVFVGDTLVLGRRVGPGGGYASVTVDGVVRGILSFDFPVERWRVPATFNGFGPGVHLLSLTLNRYQPQTGSTLDLDFATAPSPYAPSAAQVQAVERVNWHRTIAGLERVAGALSLHQAAQAHSEYYARNRTDPRLAGLGFHQEHADLPGFSGKSSSDRGRYFGYWGGAGEDGHFVGDPILSVDGWMATVYHRNLVMCYSCTDAGYGVVSERNNKVDALNMGGYSGRPAERLIYTYPATSQKEIPREWNGAEIPDPMPGHARPVGYPISLYIVQPASAGLSAAAEESAPIRDASTEQESAPQWSVTAAELHTSGGVAIPVIMLDQNTDIPKYLGADVVFLIPERPLAKDTTYIAHIAGTDSRGAPFDYRWSFSTGGTLVAPDFAPSAIWSEPLLPQAEGTITYRVRLVNTGLGAEGVTVHATLPEAATYVAGSASTSQGNVSGAGPLDFAIGALPKGGSVEIRYSVKLMAGIDLPRLMNSDVTIAWSAGQIFRRVSAFAGAKEPLFLPAVVR